MAISTKELGEIVIRITAETQDAEKAMERIRKAAAQTSQDGKGSLYEFEKATSKVGVGFTSLGRLATRIGSTITTKVTNPLIAMGTAAGKTAMDFMKLREATMVGFEKLLGADEFHTAAENADKYMNELLALAQKTPYAQEAFYNSAKSLLAMGFQADEAMNSLRVLTDVAAATGKGEEGIDTLTHALGKMKASGKITLESLNAFTDLGIPAVNALANKMGITTEELLKTTKAGKLLAEDALPLLIDGLENGTDGANGATAAFGGLAEQLKSGTLTGAMDSLHTAWRTFSLSLLDANNNKEKLIALFVNLQTILKNLAPIFGNATEAAGSLLDKLVELTGKFGDFLQTADEGQLRAIGDAIINIAKAGPMFLMLGGALKMIGSGFRALSGFAKIAQEVKIFQDGMRANVELASKARAGLVKLGSEAGVAITNFARGVPVFGQLSLALENVSAGALKVVARFLPIGFVISAIIGTITYLKNHWEEITNQFNAFAQNIGLEERLQAINDAFSNLSNAIGGQGGGLFGFLSQAFELVGAVIVNIAIPAIELFISVITAVLPPIINALAGIITFVSGVAEAIANFFGIFTGDVEKFDEGLTRIGEGIVAFFTNIPAIIEALLSGIVSGIEGILAAIFPMGVEVVTSFVDGIGSAVGSLGEAAGSLMQGFIDGITGFFGSLFNAGAQAGNEVGGGAQNEGSVLNSAGNFLGTMLANGINAMMGALSSAGTAVADAAKNAITGIFSGAAEWGSHMVQGIIDGINGMIGAAAGAAGSLASTVAGFLHFTRPDEGPLRPYETWMPHFIQGLTETLDKSAPELVGRVKELSTDISDSMTLDDFSATASVTKNLQVSGGLGLSGSMGQMIGLMQTMIANQNQKPNYQLVLDTGIVAGEMTTKIDRNLGTLDNRRSKGL